MNIGSRAKAFEDGHGAKTRPEFITDEHLEFLDELRQNCAGTVANSQIALKWDYPASMPVVISDPVKLKIILLNLVMQ